MAVVTRTSTIITNRDAKPVVLTDASFSAGGVRETQGNITGGSADSIASVYKLCTVPSNARVTSLLYQNTAFGTSAAANFGVYWPTTVPVAPAGLLPSAASAGTAISASLFGAAVAIASASTSPTEAIVQGTVSIPNQEKQLWDLAGLSADPGIDLDICAALTVAATAAGILGMKVKYTF